MQTSLPSIALFLGLVLLTMSAPPASADRLVDPTRPATARAATTPTSNGIKVEAVMNVGAPAGALAIVNGKVVRAGDAIDSIKIEEILGDGVRYKRDGRSQIARVGQQALLVRHNVTVTAQADHP